MTTCDTTSFWNRWQRQLFSDRIRIDSVTSRVEGITVDHDESIFLRIPQQRRIQYQVLSEIPNRAERFRAFRRLKTKIDIFSCPRISIRGCLNSHAKSPESERLRYEKASLIESYLRRNYRYTLEPHMDARTTAPADISI